jgi:hypothetical protein
MNKKLKKLTAILLTVCLAFALCACSSGGSGTSQGTGQAQPAGGGQTTEAVQETVPAADHQAQQAETAAQTAEAGAEAANTAAQHPGIVSQKKCPGYKPGQLLAAAAGRYSNIIQHYYCKRFCRFCQGYSGKKIKIPEGCP